MSRCFLMIFGLTVATLLSGCCGPMGCGPGCGTATCNDCEGLNYGERVIHARPLDGLRQMRKNMVCGSGCGGVYYGEWISTPPDCEDPCCNDQWVGGATKARFGCWQPGMLLGNLYGSRFCADAESSVPCGCGETGCDGGCGMMETLSPSMGVPGSTCDCAGHASATPQGAVVQQTMPRSDSMTRTARQAISNYGRTRQR